VGASEPREAAKTPIKAEIHREPASGYLQQQQQQDEEHEEGRHHPGKQTHTGLSLTDFVSVDTGNANRESTEVGMQEYLKSSDRQVQTKVLTEDAP